MSMSDNSIDKAASFFIDVLKPAYDNNYNIMCDQKKEREAMVSGFYENHENFINKMDEMGFALSDATSFLEVKKDEFELLKINLDLKELNSEIKARLNK